MSLIHRPSLEHALVDHCNLRCVGCDHNSPDQPQRFADLEEFADDLTVLATVLKVDVLKLTGGEPLLHPQLYDFVRVARSCGIASQIAIWTNGLLLHRLDERLLKSIDIVHVSLYPGVKLTAGDVVRRAGEEFGVEIVLENVDEFITPLRVRGPARAEETKQVFLSCKNSHVWGCHSFDRGVYYKCSRAYFLREKARHVGTDPGIAEFEGVSIHSEGNLRPRMLAYLSDSRPLRSCYWCLGTSGEVFGHHQMQGKVANAIVMK